MMETIDNKLEEKALTWPTKAKAIAITNQETYNLAANTLIEISQLEKQIRDHHAPIKTAAFNAHKTAVAAEKRLLDPLDEAKAIIKRSISNWTIEQDNIRREAQRKIDEAEKAKKKAAEDLILQAALEAEQAGVSSKVTEAIIETSVAQPPIKPIQTTYRKVEGVSTRETWHAEVTDILALCKAISEGKVSSDLITPNMYKLNIEARLKKDKLTIPGVQAIKEVGVTVRQ